MSGEFRVRETKELEGIPVTEAGDPVEKTIVVAAGERKFAAWCKNSGVALTSRRVLFLDESAGESLAMKSRLENVRVADWPWVVFVGKHPGAWPPTACVMSFLNQARVTSQLKRAWHYPHLFISPCVVESPSLLDPGQDW